MFYDRIEFNRIHHDRYVIGWIPPRSLYDRVGIALAFYYMLRIYFSDPHRRFAMLRRHLEMTTRHFQKKSGNLS